MNVPIHINDAVKSATGKGVALILEARRLLRAAGMTTSQIEGLATALLQAEAFGSLPTDQSASEAGWLSASPGNASFDAMNEYTSDKV